MKSRAIATLKKYPDCFIINGIPHFVNKEKTKYIDYDIYEVYKNHHMIDICGKRYNYGELVATFFSGYLPGMDVRYYGCKTKEYNRYAYEVIPTNITWDKDKIIHNDMEFIKYDRYSKYSRSFYISKEGVCLKHTWTSGEDRYSVFRRGYDNPFQFPALYFQFNAYQFLQDVIYKLYKPEEYDDNKVRVFKDRRHGNCYLDNIEQITFKEYLFDYLNKEELQYILRQVYDKWRYLEKTDYLTERVYSIIKK